eukprot:6870438-Pyramimonas_sp.AAC.2
MGSTPGSTHSPIKRSFISIKDSFKVFAGCSYKRALANLDLKAAFARLDKSYKNYDGMVNGEDFNVTSSVGRGLISTVYLARYTGEQSFVSLPRDNWCLLKVRQAHIVVPSRPLHILQPRVPP